MIAFHFYIIVKHKSVMPKISNNLQFSPATPNQDTFSKAMHISEKATLYLGGS